MFYNPTISIIVPVYGTEKYLRRCLDSILAQTFQDFELILVDDGSYDSSADICDEYTLRDKRIRIIHQSNRGQSSARNIALDIANGKYIYFCDSDDWIELNLLEEVYNRIITDNADIVRLSDVVEYGNKSLKTTFKYIDFCESISTSKEKKDFILNKLLTYTFGWETCLSLFSSTIIFNNDICFPEGINIAEDLYFHINFIFFANKISGFNKHLYHYYIHENSTMGSNKGKININDINLMSYFLYNNCNDNEIRSEFYRIHNSLIKNEFNKININYKEIKNISEKIKKIDKKIFFDEMSKKQINENSLFIYINNYSLVKGLHEYNVDYFLYKLNVKSFLMFEFFISFIKFLVLIQKKIINSIRLKKILEIVA